MPSKQETKKKIMAKQSASTAQVTESSPRILVVNDDLVQLRSLAQLPTKDGKEVIPCTGGKEALSQLKKFKSVDLIIIAPQYQEKIFNKFEQIKLKQAGVIAGSSGLGRAFCKIAVEAHGGNIWVESKGEEKGATFNFTLSL